MAAPARFGAAVIMMGSAAWFVAQAVAPTSAYADTPAYELYCPGTPVGNVVLNGVITTGTITPASPAAGSQFNITNYQTQTTVPSSLAAAAAALGNTSLAGSAQVSVDATGATPATIATPKISFSESLAPPLPANGVALNLPSPSSTIGPFTASGGPIKITEDPHASLTLIVSGNPLTLTCTAYPNNAAATGITMTTPAGAATPPVIASATASGTAAVPAATTATTAAPATTASSSLASTGAGPGLYLMGFLGLGFLGCAFMLVFVDKSRRAFLRVLHRGGGPSGPGPG